MLQYVEILRQGFAAKGALFPPEQDPARQKPGRKKQDAAKNLLDALLHFIAGGIAFLALIAACFVMAWRFAALKEQGWAVYSVASGVLFFAAFVGIAAGSGQPATVIGFLIGIIIGWAWISVIAARFFGSPTPA